MIDILSRCGYTVIIMKTAEQRIQILEKELSKVKQGLLILMPFLAFKHQARSARVVWKRAGGVLKNKKIKTISPVAWQKKQRATWNR